jgi:CheY-like chemotaxis protein
MDGNSLTTLIATLGGIVTLYLNQRASFRKAAEDRERADRERKKSDSIIAKELTPNSGGSIKDCVDDLKETQETQLTILGRHSSVLSTLVASNLIVKRAMEIILRDHMPAGFSADELRMVRENPAARCKIMVVDDEENILTSFRHLLRDEFDVIGAASGAEALEALARHDDIHVVITDQKMPGMTGAELLKVLCERFPQPVRIMLTGYADIKAVVDSINVGHVYRYITKPVDPEVIVGAIREAAAIYSILHRMGD